MESKLNYVNGIYEDEISLRIIDKLLRENIKLVGGKKRFFSKDYYFIEIKSEQHKLEVLQTLIDTDNLYFAGGHDWPPSAIVEEYREKGMLKGKIKQICWTGSGPIFEKI